MSRELKLQDMCLEKYCYGLFINEFILTSYAFIPGLRVGWDGMKKIVLWDKIFFNNPRRWDDKFLRVGVGEGVGVGVGGCGCG